jgi:hypothetical protein
MVRIKSCLADGFYRAGKARHIFLIRAVEKFLSPLTQCSTTSIIHSARAGVFIIIPPPEIYQEVFRAFSRRARYENSLKL